MQAFENVKNAIFGFSLALMIGSGVSLISVKKMAVHIFSFFSVPALVYISFGLAAEDHTDWIKWALKPISRLGTVGGFNLAEEG